MHDSRSRCRRAMHALCTGAVLILTAAAALAEETPARFYSGILFVEITGEHRETLAADGSLVLVRDVIPEGPADHAGIMRGDVITAVNGTSISDGASFLKAIQSGELSEPQVEVRVFRFGKRHQFTLQRETGSDPGFAQLMEALRRIESDYVVEVPLSELVDRAVAGMYWAVGEDPPPVSPTPPLETTQLRRLSTTLDAVLKSHPQADAHKVLAAALEYLAKIDDRSGYTPARAQAAGKAGVGLALKQSGRAIAVVRAIPGSPAEASGIHPGDSLDEIDGVSVRAATLRDAWALILGPEGTTVRLTLSGKGGSRTVALMRKVIRRPELECPAVLDRFAYVRLTSFAQHTADALRDTLVRLAPANAGLRGLVLDLRDNPGGHLGGAVAVANLFVNSGRIVLVQGRSERQTFNIVATPSSASSPDLPLAVLVNDGTGSGAEITAAALQDHHRAILVGTRTAGNGDIQSQFGIGDGTLRLTTSRALRLSDKPLDGGVVPDITVPTNIHSLKEPWHPCGAGVASTEGDEAIQFALEALRNPR